MPSEEAAEVTRHRRRLEKTDIMVTSTSLCLGAPIPLRTPATTMPVVRPCLPALVPLLEGAHLGLHARLAPMTPLRLLLSLEDSGPYPDSQEQGSLWG